MRRPRAKLNRRGPTKARQTLTEAEIANWYARVDAIRQARLPKKRKLLFPPSPVEIAEEFA